MRIETVNPFGATSPEAIADFEVRWGLVFPAEYKAFLLHSNGGYPIPNLVEVPGWHGKGNSVLSFYGIHEGPEGKQLEWSCKVHKDRIPADLFSIAYDANGNEICFGWKGERTGKIYFWDHEDELDEDGDFVKDYRNVYLIADSLQEFLDNLMTSDELDARPRRKRR